MSKSGNPGFLSQLNRQQKRSMTKGDQLNAIDQLGNRIEQLAKQVQKADQDVDTLLQMIVRNKILFKYNDPESRVEKGDTLVIGILGKLYLEGGQLAEMPFQGGIADSLLINSLGSGELIPGMEEQILGKSVGDQFEVDVTFPDDYKGSEQLKGKKAQFFVVIHAAFRKTSTAGVISDKQGLLIRALIEKQNAAIKKAEEAKKATEEGASGVQAEGGEAAQQ